MEYLIHFEDGSEVYLAHHGVKGMKWGVRHERNKALRSQYRAAVEKSSAKYAKEANAGKYNSYEANRRLSNESDIHALNYRKNVKLGNAKAYREAAKAATSSKKAAKYERKANRQEAAAKRYDTTAKNSKIYSETTNKGYSRTSTVEKAVLPALNTRYANKYLHTRANNSAAASAGKILVDAYMETKVR